MLLRTESSGSLQTPLFRNPLIWSLSNPKAFLNLTFQYPLLPLHSKPPPFLTDSGLLTNLLTSPPTPVKSILYTAVTSLPSLHRFPYKTASHCIQNTTQAPTRPCTTRTRLCSSLTLVLTLQPQRPSFCSFKPTSSPRAFALAFPSSGIAPITPQPAASQSFRYQLKDRSTARPSLTPFPTSYPAPSCHISLGSFTILISN